MKPPFNSLGWVWTKLCWRFWAPARKCAFLQEYAVGLLAAGKYGAEVETFLTMAQHDDSLVVRVSVVQAVGRLLACGGWGYVVKACSDLDTQVRLNAVKVLDECHDSRAPEYLATALKDADSEVRNAAATALGRLRWPGALGPLWTEIKRWHGSERPQLLSAFEKLPGSVELVLAELGNNCLTAAEVLCEFQDSRVVPALLGVLAPVPVGHCAPSRYVVQKVAVGLFKLRDPRAAASLIRVKRLDFIICDMKLFGQMVEWCVDELRRANDAEALVAGLWGDSYDFQWRAAAALADLQHPCCAQLLLDAIRDHEHPLDERSFRLSAEILGNSKIETALEVLIGFLDHYNNFVADAAVEAIGKIGGLKAVGLLRTLTLNHDAKVRERACRGLGLIGDAEAVACLIGRLDDEIVPVARAAAVSLGEIGDGTSVQPLLMKFVPEGVLYHATGLALLRIGAPEGCAPVYQALQDGGMAADHEIFRALARHPCFQSATVLLQIVGDGMAHLQKDVEWVLTDWCQAWAVPAYIHALRHSPNCHVQLFSAKQLGEIGASEAADDLIWALEHPWFLVRETAAEALSLINHLPALDALIKRYYTDTRDQTKSKCAYVIKGILGKRWESLPEPILKTASEIDDVHVVLGECPTRTVLSFQLERQAARQELIRRGINTQST